MWPLWLFSIQLICHQDCCRTKGAVLVNMEIAIPSDMIADTYCLLDGICQQLSQNTPWYNRYNGIRSLLRPISLLLHYDVIKWEHFPRYWSFVRGIHRSPVNSQHKGQWRGALKFSLICAWMNGWVNNGEAGDFRNHHAYYDVTVMVIINSNQSLVCTCVIIRFRVLLSNSPLRDCGNW